jgi:hypothetical protein
MPDNICSICLRRISAHTLDEVKKCTDKFRMVELERTANKECVSCGDPADLADTDNIYWCHSCLMWRSQLNDGS